MEGPEALSLIPIAGLILYLGLISGYIPSPLYYRNEKWPKQYAILQLVVLIMTAARLTKYSNSPYPDNDDDNEENEEEDYEYKYDLEELSQFSNWLGTSLHKWFYKHFKEDALEVVMEIGSEFIFLGLSIILAMVVNRNDRLRKWDDTNLPMSKVFLRNFLIFISINVLFICETLLGPESSQGMYCEKTYNVTPGLIAPEYPISQLVTEFVDAWKVFHPSNLVLVRLSHSILYPSVLLLLTRRRLTTFIIWLLFTEIDFFHLLADMFHYVSGPALAEKRLEFQGGKNDCYVNVQFIQTMLAYPLNFLYLTTSLGDTFPPQQRMLLDDECLSPSFIF